MKRLVQSSDKIFADIPTDSEFSGIVENSIDPGEIVLWGFNPPPDEQTRRGDHSTLYVIGNGSMCFGGIFIMTSKRIFTYSPEVPEEKGFLFRKHGHPSVLATFTYDEITAFRYSTSIPFPIDAALSIMYQYPRDYQLPYPHDLARIIREAHEKEADPLCSSGFEIQSVSDESIRLVKLPGSWDDLRKWERLLRFTLGIKRSDLEYTPF